MLCSTLAGSVQIRGLLIYAIEVERYVEHDFLYSSTDTDIEILRSLETMQL